MVVQFGQQVMEVEMELAALGLVFSLMVIMFAILDLED